MHFNDDCKNFLQIKFTLLCIFEEDLYLSFRKFTLSRAITKNCNKVESIARRETRAIKSKTKQDLSSHLTPIVIKLLEKMLRHNNIYFLNGLLRKVVIKCFQSTYKFDDWLM
jgi:hypothetical protein